MVSRNIGRERHTIPQDLLDIGQLLAHSVAIAASASMYLSTPSRPSFASPSQDCSQYAECTDGPLPHS